AGEVKGPPATGPQTQEQVDAKATAAPAHSNSVCSFSGLNDMIPGQGPIDFHVQSPGQDVRNGGPPGIPGVACHGGGKPREPEKRHGRCPGGAGPGPAFLRAAVCDAPHRVNASTLLSYETESIRAAVR